MPQLTQMPYLIGDSGAVAVSTTVLRALGGAAWTSTATTNSDKHRIIDITNCSASIDVFVGLVATNTANAGSATSSGASPGYRRRLMPGQSYECFVPAGYDVVLVRGATSTDVVNVQEYLYR